MFETNIYFTPLYFRDDAPRYDDGLTGDSTLSRKRHKTKAKYANGDYSGWPLFGKFLCFWVFLPISSFFMEKDVKLPKKVIFNCECCANHLYAGLNTQHLLTPKIKHVPCQVFKVFLTKIMIWMQSCCEFVQKLFIFFCVIFIGVEQFIFTFVNVIFNRLSILPKISKQIGCILKYNVCIYLFIILQIELLVIIMELWITSVQ